MAPCATVAGAPGVEDCSFVAPAGFATVAVCVAEAATAGAAGAATVCAVGEVVCAGVASAVAAAEVAGGGAATVADTTLAVMLGDPAELGVAEAAVVFEGEGVGAAGVAVAVATVAGTAALLEATLVFSAAGGVSTAGPFCGGATLTLIVAGAAVCGALEVGTVFTASSGLRAGAAVV